MPIDIANGILHVHIPKTGGTSISKYLNIYNNNKLCGPSKISVRGHCLNIWRQHLTLNQIKLLHFEKGCSDPIYPPRYDVEHTWDNLFKFTFVRNPWDRDVSNFFYLKSKGILEPKATLKEYFIYVADRFSQIETGMKKGGPRPLVGHDHRELETVITHCMPQVHFLHHEYAMNFVGRYEELLHDMGVLCKLVGKTFDVTKFPWEKKAMGKSQHYTTFYDEETIHMSFLKNQLDIRAFHYKFGE